MQTNFFLNRFLQNHADIENPKVRKAYGTLSSVVCMICNILLFTIKYVAGTLSGSIAILSDAFNNLSDCASCFVTFFGCRMAAKPADKQHPFGHGRIESLTSLFIAVSIILMGVELLRNSVGKLRNPEPVTFHWLVLAILSVSIAVKLWMAFFNRKLGNHIQSSVLLATAKDSYSDVLTTTAAAVALIAALFTDAPLDGWMGIFVSLFILKTAWDIMKETIDDLLGKPVDADLSENICHLIRSEPAVLGIHDFIIHNYGMGTRIGSCHVEVPSDSEFVSIHDKIDRIEHQILEQFHVTMTIHMDPLEQNNAMICDCRAMLLQILHQLDPHLHMHDFRMIAGETHTNLIFDLVVPFDCTYPNEKLKELIDSALRVQPVSYDTTITFDREFTETDSEVDAGET